MIFIFDKDHGWIPSHLQWISGGYLVISTGEGYGDAKCPHRGVWGRLRLHYYAKGVFMVMASIISHFLENREVQLARQEVMDSIRTSIEQSTMNVGTKIGTDTMRSITNLGAYLKQLPMRYWPIAQENHAMRAMHAAHPNAE